MRPASLREPAGRRALSLITIACLALAGVATMTSGLVSCGTKAKEESSRALTSTEANRLAGFRAQNYKAQRSAVNALLKEPSGDVYLVGWVDWRRPMVYLAVTGVTANQRDGLVQAIPGVVANRPGRVTPNAVGATRSPFPPPPATPPTDKWRVRPLGAPDAKSQTDNLDTVLALLFAAGSRVSDSATVLAGGDGRWLRQDRVAGTTVDVMIGPVVPAVASSPSPTPTAKVVGPVTSPTPTKSGAFAAYGGAVRYWIDQRGTLRRLEAVVAAKAQVRVDFNQADNRAAPIAIRELGGAASKPRVVSTTEAATLARMRYRNYQARGARLSVNLPTGNGALLRAAGWVDWRAGVVYLAVYDVDTSANNSLLRADHVGVALRNQPPDDPTAAVDVNALPTLHPAGTGWTATSWAQRIDDSGASDGDLLISEILAATSPSQDSASNLRRVANWLRKDTVNGIAVNVFEVPKTEEIDLSIPAGQARLRYWVDADGQLRRLEVRTRTGGWGAMTITPGTPPPLPTMSVKS